MVAYVRARCTASALLADVGDSARDRDGPPDVNDKIIFFSTDMYLERRDELTAIVEQDHVKELQRTVYFVTVPNLLSFTRPRT